MNRLLQKQVKQMSLIIGWSVPPGHNRNLDVTIGLFHHPCQVQTCVGTGHMNIGQHHFELLVARQNGKCIVRRSRFYDLQAFLTKRVCNVHPYEDFILGDQHASP